MNICLVLSAKLSYESGSTIYAASVASALTKKGHFVQVICSEIPPLGVGQLEGLQYHTVDVMEHPVIDDYAVDSARMMESICAIASKIVALNRVQKIDIIHAHYATINAIAAMTASLVIGVPVVVTCFGRDLNNGYENDERYKRMVLAALNGCTRVICSSKEILERAIEIGAAEAKLQVMQNPIDLERFFVGENLEPWGHSLKFLTVVSCFGPEKGIEITIEGFRRYLEASGASARLQIVGQDEHPQQKNLHLIEKKIAECGLGKQVELIGPVNNSEVANLLRESDVLVDSRLVGNFSTVVLEALSCGTVVIASDAPGNAAILKGELSRLMYKRGDAASLALLLEDLTRDASRFGKIKHQIVKWREASADTYGISEHVKHLVELYEQQIKEMKTHGV